MGVLTRSALAVALGLQLALVGCGGGSSSSSSSSGSSDTAATAPAVTTQPSSQTVTAGTSVTFSVVATGTATLSYQWRKGGTAIAGATSASYAIAAAATGDAGSYDVVVTNTAGSVTSSAATLTVNSSTAVVAPAITTQPTTQSAATGASVTFTAAASGTSPLTYQWYKDSAAISSATAASYTISSVATTDAGSYTVKVSNSAGSVTSSAAVLSVTSNSTSTLSAATVAAAQSFAATLSTTQQSTVQLSWAVDTARRWSNLPAAMVSRNGVAWSSLSTAQQTAARSLISTALSSAGNTLHQGMQAADDYLAANGGGTSTYGAGNFYIAFLGTPSASNFWMLQLTGHHLTYNIAFNGSYKSATPMFLAIEPKASFTLNGTSYDPMSAQRTAMGNLGAALTSYSGAKLSGTYNDLLFGANGSGGIDGACPRSYSTVTDHGLLYSSLSATDKALVQEVIKSYVNTQASEYSSELLAAYLSDTALASTYVAYTGTGNVTTANNYFRIEGPRVWIEFSVPRGVIFNSDIHYHTIWRDKLADYGGKCVG